MKKAFVAVIAAVVLWLLLTAVFGVIGPIEIVSGAVLIGLAGLGVKVINRS